IVDRHEGGDKQRWKERADLFIVEVGHMAVEKVDITQIIDKEADVVLNAHRKASFKNAKWCYDKDPEAVCTGEKLADAGFHYTGNRDDPSAATCAFCLKEMIFDPTDDPWEEHVSHSPDCFFVRFNEQDENRLTMEQFLKLIAFRKSNMTVKWLEDEIEKFKAATSYVENMKPKPHTSDFLLFPTCSFVKMSAPSTAEDSADRNVEIWKIKKLIKGLELARGNGTSMISLIIPPRDQIPRVAKMLAEEYGTASNIKSRVNRLSVLGAITSVQGRLKLYSKVPPNGLVVYCGTIISDEGKEKKVNIDFEPFKPINTSLYLCDNKFHTEALQALLADDSRFGFIVMDGNGCLFGTLQGNTREVLHKFTVDLPKKHGRGGQSALRFARLRMEKRHNYVRKVAETAVEMFIKADKVSVAGLILAGSADFKTELGQSDMFDQRLQAKMIKTVDISYGGENGFNQAIELSADALANVKFIQEKKLIGAYFDEISQDSGKYVFGVKDTIQGLEMGAIETLICWENLDIMRYKLKNGATGEEKVMTLRPDEEKNFTDPATQTELEVVENMPLLEWLANSYKGFGAALEIVTDKSQEGAQFVKGFGGIGGLLRYRVDFAAGADFEEEDRHTHRTLLPKAPEPAGLSGHEVVSGEGVETSSISASSTEKSSTRMADKEMSLRSACRKIVCVGRNYVDHAKELGNAIPSKPLLFVKTSNALIEQGEKIRAPPGCVNLHQEAELAVVIGKKATNVSRDAAYDYVRGYTVALDMTARDFQDEAKKSSGPWFLAKSFDTSCPIGEFVSKDKITDPHSLEIYCLINGVQKQRAKTNLMLFDIPTLIEYTTKFVTLEEGDLLLTGTPAGVGPVKSGDVIECGLKGVTKATFTVA
uniref:Eukaryotic peptide chain release factor subunit 1 n=1 Tax=Pristionchus pacificus TaxID=54126 RepID=A0A2A6CGE0_PRIPA